MKKLIALLLALVMVIGLVACGAKEEAAAPAATEAAKEEAAAPAPEAEAAPAEGPMSEEDAEAAVAADGCVILYVE